MNPRKKFRALVAKPGYAIVPGTYDTLTARLVQLVSKAAEIGRAHV